MRHEIEHLGSARRPLGLSLSKRHVLNARERTVYPRHNSLGAAHNMSTDDYDPTKAPQVRLWTHILQKGFQAGSVLGTGIIAPAQAAWQFFKHQHALDPAQFANATGRTTAAVFGLVAILGAARTSQIDKEGFEDRAYRLYYNKGQNRTDAFAQVGALAGLAAGALLFRGAANVTAFHYLGAASTGTAVGVLAHVLSMPKEE